MHVLRYTNAERNNGVVRRHFLAWRRDQGIPIRCDSPACHFYREPLVWNGQNLLLILEHCNGVNSDNRPGNLRLLCPNCDSQSTKTRGGANAGRVEKSDGGFAIVERSTGLRHHTLPAEAGYYELRGQDVGLSESG
jgi:hypothetical protein